MAPPVAVYVAAAVVGVAAAYVFKEYVYEPHLAPRFEAWAEEFLERRRAARSRRASAVPVPASRRRRDSTSSSDASQHDNDPQEDLTEGHGVNDFSLDGFELEALATKEVDEWRNAVLRSQERTRDGLRRRANRPRDEFDSLDTTNTTLDESVTSLTHTPLAYVISNISSPATTSTVSLPQTPPRHSRSESHSTTQGDGSTIFIAPQSSSSSVHEAPTTFPRTPSPISADPTPHRPSDGVGHLDITSPAPLQIPDSVNHTPAIEAPPHPLPFTPTYQVMADDSPFGPLLPDTPRSSAEVYGERPFSPLTRVMGPSSGPVSASARGAHPSRANSMNSIRTLGGSAMLRKGSGLVNELIIGGSDDGDLEDDHPLASALTSPPANAGSPMNLSVVSSLSERYPAPPTPPIIVSPPGSAADVISAPSSPSSGSEVVIHTDPVGEGLGSPAWIASRAYRSLPTLQLPQDSSSDEMSRSGSQGYSGLSPALSYASFLSPMPVSRAGSGSEADEFMTVASDESDWSVSVVSPRGPAQVVQDGANNPFLDFEQVTNSVIIEGHGLEHERNDEGEDGSDDSWGSARRH